MGRRGVGGRGRWAGPILVLPLLLGATGCEEDGDTINVNGLDCGLIREDLFGDWALTFVPGITTLQNCDDPTFNDTPVDVNGFTTVYDDTIAFLSPSGVSVDVRGSGPELSNELMASVEADSCLAAVQKWESAEAGWVQCIGTLDRAAHAIAARCDSMDLDVDVPPDGFPDVACTLEHSLTLQVFTP